MEVTRPANRLQFDLRRCTGCGRCVAACGERRLTLETVGNRKHAQLLDGRDCLTCRKCVEECLIGAISL